MIGSNGKSYMDFDVRITKQSLNQINQFQVDDVATYNVGVPGSIEMKMTSEALTEFSAVTIYRIVVVEVVWILLYDNKKEYGWNIPDLLQYD